MDPMLSYAQNGEDVVLQRAFGDQPKGFYIDVGACHPVEDSVTRHFYRKGWRGVNIEPDRALHAALAADRPEDINLCVAIGRERGRATFFPTGVRGHGTLSSELAAERSQGRTPETVPRVPLTDILECYGPEDGTVDFLKVDVEGFEAEVVSSLDWNRCRPRVVLIESVDDTGSPTHASWEPLLLEARYRFALFDGLNRFYFREEEADRLMVPLSAPANVLDHWMRARDAEAHTGVAKLHAALTEANQRLAEERERAEAALGEASRATAKEREKAEAALSEAGRAAAEERERAEAALGEARRMAAEERERAEAALGKVNRALADERSRLESTCQENEVLAIETRRSKAQLAAGLRRAEAAEAQVATLEMDLLRMKTEQDHWQRRLHEANAMLSAFRSSTSWRVTAPMRRAVDFARGQNRNGMSNG